MMDHDDVRFSSFTRDLTRRHRRPRSYPPPPVRQDVLEQLCGGGSVAVPTSTSLTTLATLAGISLPDLSDFEDESDDLDLVDDLDVEDEAS